MNAIKKQPDLIYHEHTLTFQDEEKFKQLDTGQLYFHYRTSYGFIVREKVLHGFRKQFLDSVDVFTHDGCLIGKVYRIRNADYRTEASLSIVEKILFEYLYSDENRKSIGTHIEQLYTTKPSIGFVNNFIVNHQK